MSENNDKLEPEANIDPNVWWHISEWRVDTWEKKNWGSRFRINTNTNELWVGPNDSDQSWQFQPVDDVKGRYALRLSHYGAQRQLSVCYYEDEVDDSRTRPCMVESSGDDEQKWDIANWGNDTLRFINVRNGSDYYMDCHRGNPPFMSSNTDHEIFQPAQRWLMTSVSDVNDGAMSTTYTRTHAAKTTITDSSTTRTIFEPSSDVTKDSSGPAQTSGTSGAGGSDDGGISTGAAAGIGVGAGLGTILIALGIFFLFWRRRNRNKANQHSDAPLDHQAYQNMGHHLQHSNHSPSMQENTGYPPYTGYSHYTNPQLKTPQSAATQLTGSNGWTPAHNQHPYQPPPPSQPVPQEMSHDRLEASELEGRSRYSYEGQHRR